MTAGWISACDSQRVSMNRLDQVRAKMLTIVGEQLVRHEMFTIDWQFSSRRGLSSASG
jgi:hypothetical protein